MGYTFDEPCNTNSLYNTKDNSVVLRETLAGKDCKALSETLLKTAQPGDVFVIRNQDGSGHAMIVVGDLDGDGQKEIIHSTGNKIDMSTGDDAVEAAGSLVKEPAVNRMGERALANRMEGFALLRPLQGGAKDCQPTASAKARMQYPSLTIHRTVSCGYYGSPAAGSTVTYTIELSNTSGKDYTVPVTEYLPDGTEFVSAKGLTCGNKTLMGAVELPSGTPKTVSYTVKVTAPRGTTIVSSGMVADIPSNTLRNTVSGKTIDAAKLQNRASWQGELGAEMPAGLASANAVYRYALGVDLHLPETMEELSADIFVKDGTDLRRASNDSRCNQMVVDGLCGGKLVLAENRAMELRRSYLQAGDLLIAADNAADQNPDVLFSDGIHVLRIHGKTVGEVSEIAVRKLFAKNIFCVLRPALAEDDLTASQSAAIQSRLPFTDVAPQDWYYAYVRELSQKGIVSGVTATTFEPDGKLNYGQALKLIVCGLGFGEQKPAGNHWASGYLSYAKAKKWLTEDVDLNDAISRLAFCRIAAKAKKLTVAPANNPFKDCDDPAVLALSGAGIISGIYPDTFAPEQTLTRAQISKIIWSMTK